MPKARAQKWHPRSLAMGKQREFQSFYLKPLIGFGDTPQMPYETDSIDRMIVAQVVWRVTTL